MTLIAIATYGDRAEFITDTASYSRYVETLGKTTKHLTLNHLDAAVLTQGNSRFGDDIQGCCLQASRQVTTFDELVATAADWVRGLWRDVRAAIEDPSESAAFLVGWSDEHQRFDAYVLSSVEDFTPRRIIRPWVFPTPWDNRPDRLELSHVAEWMEEGTFDDFPREVILATWRDRPILQPPRDVDAWRSLAVLVREQRALDRFARVIVAGEVHHTRLERGAVTSRKIHTFDDAGEEFLQLVAFTHHPLAQTTNCWCESGMRFIECCLAEELDKPCGCGKPGRTFRDCCAVPVA